MRTRLRERVRWLVPALVTVVALGAPGVVAAAENVAPSVTATVSNANPVEPQTVVASATFTDPESAIETYTCSIDYGDGSVVAGVVSGLTCTGPAHQYLVSGAYSVRVTVTDSSGATGTGTSGATYQNWAPWVGGGLVGSFVVGSPVHDVAAVEDPGAAFETYTCTVDYGDGSGVQAGTYVPDGWSDGLPRCVGPDHIYNAPGSYSIITTATDSAGETGSSLVIETIIVGSVVDPVEVGPVSLPYAFEVGVPVSASATFVDLVGKTYTCTVDYGDGGGAQPGSIDGPSCSGPSHTYSQNGDYAVTVRVTDSNGGVGTSSVDIGLSNIGPSITGLTFNPGPSLDGSPVRLIATITDPGMAANPPETYTCNVYYGDGTGGQDGTVSGNQCIGPAHIFPGLGPYPVTVMVFDSNGGGGYATIDITLLNIAPVVTGYFGTIFGPSGIHQAAYATFSDPGSAPGTPPESYTCTIDYGDGAGPQPGVIAGNICTGPDHAYASKGTYTFVATVTDSNGGAGAYTLPIEIYNTWPIVGAVSVPVSSMVGTAVTASAAYVSTGLVPADTCTVDYGDGAGPLAGTADGAICTGPSHNYASVGTFTITVMILSEIGSTGSSSATIHVNSLQVGAVSVSGTLTEGSWVAASATFTPTGRQTYKCTVNYGDGAGAQVGTISGTTCRGPSHKYAIPGDYTVTVAVTGSKGYSGSASVAVSVINAVPGSVTPSFAQTMLKLGSTATLTVRFVDPGTGETYTGLVYWGDGTQSAVTVTGATRQFSVSHRYARAGCYYVWVSVTEPDGRGEMVPVPTMPNAPDASIVIYDPARTLSGSGKLSSPSDACLLTKACQVASTASFSLSARYAAGATKPTVSFSYTAAGLSFAATSADFMVASQGRLTIRGAGKVNGVSGFSFLLVASDGIPGTLWLTVNNARTGQTVYQGVEGQPLLSGSISIR